MTRPGTHIERSPSRHTNPFATCWTKPGALPFQFPAGESAEQLVARLGHLGWRGEIVGPHGSGKSTLLESLQPQLVAAGRSVAAIALHEGDRRLPAHFLREALAHARPLLIVDGYEQLSCLGRRMLRARCRFASAGLLVTSHASTGLPKLFHTQPDLTLAKQLVSTLTAQRFSPISAADVAASHACHGSNLRELLFALYDRHESLAGTARAAMRTARVSSS